MRDFMRFLFPAADRDAIDPGSLVVEDTPYHASPSEALPYPQSLRVEFDTTDPAADPPQLRPLFPGELAFIVDPSAPGALPDPDTVTLDHAGYTGWKTEGTLMVSATLPEVTKGLKDHLSGIEVVPTVVWYAGITLSEDFLLDTLVNGLRRKRVLRDGDSPAVGTNDDDWEKHAVAGFLKGTYRPDLRLGSDASSDDVAAHSMPVVTERGAGGYELIVSAAAARRPQDASRDELDDITSDVTLTSAAHARYGAIPARHVYRSARPRMIGAPAGNAVADTILADWPTGPRYFAIRSTRTWKLIENASVHFPEQSIRVQLASDNSELAHQRLASHGVFYLKQDPGPQQPQAPTVTIEFDGGMRWLAGEQSHVWREQAATAPVQYDLSTTPSPHIQLRVPMSEAMMREPADTPGGMRCTYMSMRRSMRALVDNRIAGGRLNYGRGSTSGVTRDLIQDAWTEDTDGDGDDDIAAHVGLVRDNRPSVNLDPGAGGSRLEPIFIAFFPDDAPAHEVDGSTNRTQVLTLGEVGYALWQSIPELLQNAGTRSNFSDDHIGRGGAGALVALGLAAGFEVDVERGNAETPDDYAERVATAMLTGLEPGAVLQLWNDHRDFEALKDRSYSSDTNQSYGHSPVFVEYLSDDDGIKVFDQGGERECEVDNDVLEWLGSAQEVWVAANWTE